MSPVPAISLERMPGRMPHGLRVRLGQHRLNVHQSPGDLRRGLPPRGLRGYTKPLGKYSFLWLMEAPSAQCLSVTLKIRSVTLQALLIHRKLR